MTPNTQLPAEPVLSPALVKPMLIGAGIALAVIALFLSGVKNPPAAWGSLWMLKPLIIVPLAGAAGGACFHFTHRIFQQGGWNKGLASVLGVFIFIVGLWLGTVLGLNGTLWN